MAQTISEIGEFLLIERLRSRFSSCSQRVSIGIGDDSSILTLPSGKLLVLTTDTLVEGVHFQRPLTPSFTIGWKAISSNISDIAAMGGTPLFSLSNFLLPHDLALSSFDEISQGVWEASQEFGIDLVGGDISSSQTLAIVTSVAGYIEGENVITRGGARIGDKIFVTGSLGGSAAGYFLLKMGVKPGPRGRGRLVRRHLMPRPRLREGRILSTHSIPNSMIDLSDGLAGDLRHIASESKVGVKVFRHKVPVEDGVKEVCQELGQRLEDLTLYWGEDYELLFTVPDERVERLKELGIPATLIGEVVDLREGCFLVDSRGRREPLREMGYEHFSSKRLY